jgi:hypothetical protein
MGLNDEGRRLIFFDKLWILLLTLLAPKEGGALETTFPMWHYFFTMASPTSHDVRRNNQTTKI